MTKEERLKKRHQAEKRFRFYGLASIFVALLFVAILVQNIFSKGSSAFKKTVITTEVFFDQELLEIQNGASTEEIMEADFYDIMIENLIKAYPAKDRKEEDQLLKLFSGDAEIEIKKAFLKNNNLIGKTITLDLTASDDIDQLHKGNYPRDLPEERRRISDFQLVIYDYFVENKKISKNFNNYFFNNGDSRDPELAGIGGALVGSFYSILICLLLAFPVAVLASIYLEEFAPKNRFIDFVEVNINNLAAVPSIIYGLLGLAVFINFFGMPRSAPLVGGLVLALMTFPVIIIASRAALQSVPPSITDAALGVGASKIQTVFDHVFPLALPGMLTGSIIGMARALGESAPLLMIGMVAFVVDVPSSPLDSSAALPVQVYLWADAPERGFVERTSAAILVLLFFLLLMNSTAIWLRNKFETKW